MAEHIASASGTAYGMVVNPDGSINSTAVSGTSYSIIPAGSVNTQNSLITEYYDAGSCLYTGENMTSVLFYSGGVAGTTVATVDLTYSGTDNVLSTFAVS